MLHVLEDRTRALNLNLNLKLPQRNSSDRSLRYLNASRFGLLIYEHVLHFALTLHSRVMFPTRLYEFMLDGFRGPSSFSLLMTRG